MLGFTGEALVTFLTFDEAAEVRAKDITAEAWAETTKLRTREAILAEMTEYMAFAWGKVENHRSISASRSVTKFKAWVWLLGDPDLTADYPQYGAPILREVCERFGFPIPEGSGLPRMANGDPCVPGW